jgi:hypothetical protein
VDYMIYFFELTGRIVARRDIDCNTEEEASTFARTLTIPPGGKLEIWHRATHVATIE